MSYAKRLTLAATLSVLLHVAILSPGGCGSGPKALGRVSYPEPIVLNLQPPEPPYPPRLVETRIPADEPLLPTDLISDRNSKAQDLSEVQGARPAPYVEDVGEFDDLDTTAPPPEEPPEPVPVDEAIPPSPVEPGTQAPEPGADSPAPSEAVPETGTTAEAEPQAEPLADHIVLADAAQAPPVEPPSAPHRARGRVDGGVKHNGLVGFEAVEDKMAPHLLEIRRRVELEWFAILSLRYSGTSPTRAVLDCAIDSEGRLVSVEIVEAGDSASYAPLCKEALERAAPFPPFPPEIPDVYRSKNIEITWTFNFLK